MLYISIITLLLIIGFVINFLYHLSKADDVSYKKDPDNFHLKDFTDTIPTKEIILKNHLMKAKNHCIYTKGKGVVAYLSTDSHDAGNCIFDLTGIFSMDDEIYLFVENTRHDTSKKEFIKKVEVFRKHHTEEHLTDEYIYSLNDSRCFKHSTLSSILSNL